MDNESKQALRVLEGLAAGFERIVDFSRLLQGRPEVLEVQNASDIRSLLSGPTIWMYADATLRNNKGICWWLEINWTEEEWIIESHISINDFSTDADSPYLEQFPDKPAKTIDDFLDQFEKAVSELVNSLQTIDLSAC